MNKAVETKKQIKNPLDVNSSRLLSVFDKAILKAKQKTIAKQLKLFFLTIISSTSIFANNVTVSNISLTGQNVTSDFTLVEFDISWENSWRINGGAQNWDAAWVFVKYRLKTETDWNHASLNWVDGTGSGDGHTEPANSNIASANDNGSGNSYGAFIHSSVALAQGNISYSNVQLRWEYGYDGLNDSDSVEVYVYAIEMVYVPQGSFELGSSGSETDHFYKYPTSTNTYTVSSEAAITVGTTNDNLYYASSLNGGDQTGPIPAAFPKGYSAFYCMKYEISQEQYVEFLNKLTGTQATARYPGSSSNRHTITIAGNYSTTNPYIACNYLSWADVAAYLDWAALRPMTELEFEKSCRGLDLGTSLEFAWGDNLYASSNYTINDNGLDSEGIDTNYSTSSGNAIYADTDGTINGPLRCGIFSAHSNNLGRQTAGSTYYGIMEMSGNLCERPVTAGNSTGRSFDGTNGDGELNAAGSANVSNWPGDNGNGASNRGGGWSNALERLRVSYRGYGAYTYSGRVADFGGRGVRLAP